MYTIIIGENNCGKTRYLNYLHKAYPNSYFMQVDDVRDYPVDKALAEDVFWGSYYNEDDGEWMSFGNGDNVSQILPYIVNMCRKCDLLLVDDVSFHLDMNDTAWLVSGYLGEIGKRKEVVSVTYDPFKLVHADRIITVTWEGELPVVKELTIDEAEELLYESI